MVGVEAILLAAAGLHLLLLGFGVYMVALVQDMSRMTDGSDRRVVPKDQVNSPSIDEESSGGSMVAGGGSLKKGPWTSQEDAILVEYVKKHGEGNWNAVQKHSGLSRCGKSCRLRWANHLRPNLKKGAFSQEEEQLIIELHARMGNKWARMAAHLPGRTDNEIKNYWNTRIKRRQRANLPLYPPDICFQASNENEHSQGANDLSNGDKQHTEFFQGGDYDIPEFKIDNIVDSQGVLSYAPPFPDISLGGMLSQGFGSQGYDFMNPTVSRPKRLRDSEILFPGLIGSINNGISTFERFPDEPPEKFHQTFELGYQFDPDPGRSQMHFVETIPGSHALLNGNYSASRPLSRSLKLELPSLQVPETDLSSWIAFPSTPSPEPVDTYIQSPPGTESLQSDSVSIWNSGMLEALLHEAQTLSVAKNQPSEKSSYSSEVTLSEMVGSSPLNNCETDWEAYNDPISPLGRSAASIFNECTTPLSGSSLDELLPPKASSGERVPAPSSRERVISPQPEFLRPDALLGSDWIETSSQISRDHYMLNEAIAALLGEDVCKKASAGMPPSFAEGKGFDSYPWNNMPSVCQISEQP